MTNKQKNYKARERQIIDWITGKRRRELHLGDDAAAFAVLIAELNAVVADNVAREISKHEWKYGKALNDIFKSKAA